MMHETYALHVLTVQCRSLKRELVRAQEEIKRIQSVPLVIGQFMEAIDQKWVQGYDPGATPLMLGQ